MTELWDIHCHILPGVDDGADTMEEALALLEEEYRQGVYHVILTPHYRLDMFEPDMRTVENNFRLLKEELRELGKTQEWAAHMEIFLGCEFHSNMDMVETLNRRERPTMAGTQYILIEFAGADSYTYIRERCQTMRRNGYRPIIAHVERYQCLRENHYEHLEELSDSGMLIQVNAASVLGKDGYFTARWCRKAIKLGLVDFIASDAHNMTDRRIYMKRCCDLVIKKYGSETAKSLFQSNSENMME